MKRVCERMLAMLARACPVHRREGFYLEGTFLSGALLALLLAGCVSQPEGVRMSAAAEQDDIPIPTNFEFDSAQSYVYDVPTAIDPARFRSWCGYYRGEGTQSIILPWYVEEMPKRGWQLKNIDEKTKRLYFEKGDEYATVSLSRELDAGAAKYMNIVKIQIRPLGPEDFTVDQNIDIVKGKGPNATTPSNEGQMVPTASRREGEGTIVPAIPEGEGAPGEAEDAAQEKNEVDMNAEVEQVEKSYEE